VTYVGSICLLCTGVINGTYSDVCVCCVQVLLLGHTVTYVGILCDCCVQVLLLGHTVTVNSRATVGFRWNV